MLREQLLDLARRFLDLPSPRPRRARSSSPRPSKKR
jgi:hypothetical protein